MKNPLVSIVIPVLHDAHELEALLSFLLQGNTPNRQVDDLTSHAYYEVIVVNGDPADPGIARLCQRFQTVRWTASEPGRGRQMNVGAQLATGQWLLFLHADTCPEPGWFDGISRVARDPDAVGGALCFKLQTSILFARIVEFGVAWRVRHMGLPYGDQGIFVRRDVFEQLGGYRLFLLMEDVDLVRRIRRCGRMVFLNNPIYVSPRRWEREGWTRRTVTNICILAAFLIGISPSRLARLYYGKKNSECSQTNSFSHEAVADSLRWTRRIQVIIPALDEADAIGALLTELPEFVSTVVVVDNGSKDETAEIARAAGATVVREEYRGYGSACLAGLGALSTADVIVFLDADRSDYPSDMWKLVEPILGNQADLVMGDRAGVCRPLVARVGTALCVGLINRLWGTRYCDLGPFRAVRYQALTRLEMSALTYGWTIEMQVKAAEANLKILELPINQRPRLGKSKVSGSLNGTIRAGVGMLLTIWSLWRTRNSRSYVP
jgi:hypothetical protein